MSEHSLLFFLKSESGVSGFEINAELGIDAGFDFNTNLSMY